MKVKLVEDAFENSQIDDYIIYNESEGMKKRVNLYRKYVGLDESCAINENDIVEWAFNKVCVDEYCDPNRLKSELLGKKWSDYED